MRMQTLTGWRPSRWLFMTLLLAVLSGCNDSSSGSGDDQGSDNGSTDTEEPADDSGSDDNDSDDSSDGDDTADGPYEGIALYLQKPEHWDDARIHFWQVDAGHGDSSWPGEAMEAVEDDWYRYTFDDATLVNMVLNGAVDDALEQSVDMQRTTSGCVTLDIGNPNGDGHYSGDWSRECDPMTDAERLDRPTPDLDISEATGDPDHIAFVHLFEWSWNDIAQECADFLGPNGYTAVQVSPPQEHIVGETWWTRYQPVSYRLESRSGTRAEFIDMIDTCAAAGVDIYADLVINHTADMDSVNDIEGLSAGGDEGIAGTAWTRMNHDSLFGDDRDDDFSYNSNSYHGDCVIQGDDYANDADRVRTCQLANLPDLKTGDPTVQATLASYIVELLDLGVKGFRVDAAKHMAVEDIEDIFALVNADFDGNYYLFSEVIDMAGTEAITSDEYIGIGPVEEFKYSANISRLFKDSSQPLHQLGGLGEPMGFLDSDLAVVFTDNHDNQRGHGAGGNILTYKDGDLYTLGNLFMLAHPYGYPRLMSSYAFDNTEIGPPSDPVHNGSLNCGDGDWVCEHRQPEIRAMVDFRRATAGSGITEWWDNEGNQVAFARDGAGFFALNGETDVEMEVTLQTTLPEGSYCNVIAAADGDCTDHQVPVNAEGEADLQLAAGEVMALINEDVPPFGTTTLYVQSGEQVDGTPTAMTYAGNGLYTVTAVFDPARAEEWGDEDHFDFKIADEGWSPGINFGSDDGAVLTEGEVFDLHRAGDSGNLSIAVTQGLLGVEMSVDFSDPDNATLTLISLTEQ